MALLEGANSKTAIRSIARPHTRITSEEDVTKLQEDLAALCKWSTEWLMLFNVDNVRFCTWVICK
jgi:hypothetical protein